MLSAHLPTTAFPFIGRTSELTRIADLLTDPYCRLITLVGPGGIGKTRLAIEAARQHPSACFVPLQPLTSSDFLVSAIADALDFQFYSGSDPKQQLFEYLGGKSWLLVLDNFEHLLEGAMLLSEIVAHAPDIRLLVTSRERLNLVEEWTVEVDGLAYPVHEGDIELYSAVELFIQQARRVKVNFGLTEKNRDEVGRICRLVGGVPLGIELAASWVRALSCEAIAEEIERSLDILESPSRNGEPRHRTMRAAFEPTWARLSEEERALFMKLSVFRGGFTREAAEAVADTTLRTLTTLVDKSLLRVAANGRYDLHELLRQYAAEKLDAQADEAEQAHDRHCHYYCQFLAESWQRITGSQIKAAFDEIEIELDNIRSAWDWALVKRKSAEIEAALVSWQYFHGERGRYHEGERAFSRAVSAFMDTDGASIRTRAKLQARLAWMLIPSHGADKGLPLVRESILVLRRIGARHDLAFALHQLAMFLSDNNLDSVEAGECLQESFEIFKELDDRWQMACVLSWLSIYHHREFMQRGVQGALERAEAYAYECLALFQQLDSPRIADAYLNLADVAHLRGDYETCKLYAGMSLDIFREIGTYWGITISLMLMAKSACKHGLYHEARWRVAQGLQSSYDYRLTPVNFFSLHHLAIAHQIWLGEGALDRAYEMVGFLDQLHQKSAASLRRQWAFSFLRLLKDDLPPHLRAAVERGRARDADPYIREIIADFSTPPESPNLTRPNTMVNPLSERELDVLRLVAEGCSNQEIADRLFIGVSTVKKHINHIYDKLDVKNRTQAVAVARERHLLTH